MECPYGDWYLGTFFRSSTEFATAGARWAARAIPLPPAARHKKRPWCNRWCRRKVSRVMTDCSLAVFLVRLLTLIMGNCGGTVSLVAACHFSLVSCRWLLRLLQPRMVVLVAFQLLQGWHRLDWLFPCSFFDHQGAFDCKKLQGNSQSCRYHPVLARFNAFYFSILRFISSLLVLQYYNSAIIK